MKGRYSLRGRTQRAFLLPLGLTVLVILLLTGVVADQTLMRQRDRQMLMDAELLLLLTRHEALEGDALGHVGHRPEPEPVRTSSSTEFRVWSPNGVVTSSLAMPPIPRRTEEGYGHVGADAESWRIFMMPGHSPGTSIEVVERISVRRAMVREIVVMLALPLLALALAVSVIGSVQVRRAIKPLDDLAKDLGQRSAQDMAEVRAAGLPNEILPLIDALNQLFGRLQHVMDAERAFSGNAAHELRTPLAAVRANAQLIEGDLHDNPVGMARVRRLIDAVDRATVTTDQLLVLARVDRLQPSDSLFNLSDVVEDTARTSASDALERGIEFDADIAPAVMVHGDAVAMATVVRNLIDNAIKFTPSDGHVTVSLRMTKGQAVLSVADSGCGFPAGDERRMFERFQRGGRREPGSGLGLAIVKSIVDAHHGRIDVERLSPSGVKIIVSLAQEKAMQVTQG